jgi:hypothetical protein
MTNSACKHGIFPELSCSYCNGKRIDSDFSGISKNDTFIHFNKPMGARLPSISKNMDGYSIYEAFDQEPDFIKANLSWD